MCQESGPGVPGKNLKASAGGNVAAGRNGQAPGATYIGLVESFKNLPDLLIQVFSASSYGRTKVYIEVWSQCHIHRRCTLLSHFFIIDSIDNSPADPLISIFYDMFLHFRLIFFVFLDYRLLIC